jgi:hypothetical protein
MQSQNKELTLFLFFIRLIERSKKYGMGQAYIQSQLEEVWHQLKLHYKKVYKDLHHEL